MTLLEILIPTIGAAVSKGLLRVWLKEAPLVEAAATSTVDVFRERTNSIIAARKGARAFEAIGDKVALNLEPLFRSYEFGIGNRETSWQAVAGEAAEAIKLGNISSKLLAQLNNDPAKIAAHIKQSHPGGTKMLSELESNLYNRTVELSAQYFAELAPSLPDYKKETFTEVLERIDTLLSRLNDIFTELDKVRSASERYNPQNERAYFEADYRAGVIRNLDQIKLIGVDIPRSLRRYQLSVAYVSLDTSARIDGSDDDDGKTRQSVETALSTTSRAVIIGEAGSGKTTLLRWLAVRSAGNSFSREMNYWQQTVPFYIELRHFPEQQPSLEDLIRNSVPEVSQQIPSGYILDVFRSGRALLLIDGFDEVPTIHREQILDWLDSLSEISEQTKVVLTSRPSAVTDELLDDFYFEPLYLPAMRYPNVELFIQQWHDAVLLRSEIETSAVVHIIVAKLLDQLRNNVALFRLATNPLLCAMICALHYDRQTLLPSDRSALYEACISMLLERRDLERRVKLTHYPVLSYKQKRLLLDDLAYWMIRNGYSRVKKEEVASRFSKRLASMQTVGDKEEIVLKMLIDRSGILREPSVDSVDFIHKTFQEYMAASAISSEGDWGNLIRNALDDQWQETIVLAVGFANEQQASQLIIDLLEKADIVGVNRTYVSLLALSCLETAVAITPEVTSRVEDLLNILIPPQSKQQVTQIAASGDLAVPYLKRNKTYTEDETVNCIDVLGRIGSLSALSQLRDYVHDRRKPVVMAFEKVLGYLMPSQLLESGLSFTLLSSIVRYHKGDSLTISGRLINALSSVESEQLQQTFKEFSLLEINAFEPSNIYILSALPHLKTLTLDGDLEFDAEILLTTEIEELNLRNRHDEWPDFRNVRMLPSLKTLRVRGESDPSSPYALPRLLDFTGMPNLRSLSLFVESAEDFDFTGIDRLRKLERLHLATEEGHIYEFEELSNCHSLRELELSSLHLPDDLDLMLYGLSELKQIKKLILNFPGSIKQELAYDELDAGSILGPNCSVIVSQGWSENKWYVQ